RSADNWQPLIAICDAAGGVWSERGREVAKLMSSTTGYSEQTIGICLLEDIKTAFAEKGVDRLSSQVRQAVDPEAACQPARTVSCLPWNRSNRRRHGEGVQAGRLHGLVRAVPLTKEGHIPFAGRWL